MNLFNYQAELDASRALVSLREELEINIRSESAFDTAATACEMLCLIAQSPDHYLGLELMRVLDFHDKYPNEVISSMIHAFLINIHTHIEYQRGMVKRVSVQVSP